MRLTYPLCRQHLDRMFKRHWIVQGKRIPRDTVPPSDLEALPMPVNDVNELLKEELEPSKRVLFRNEETAEKLEKISLANLPKYKVYNNETVLIEGLPQASVLTKTIEINEFPAKIEQTMAKQKFTSDIERNIKGAILAATTFDAQQVKLPKVKVADRPGFNLPRQYGISTERKIHLLLNKLIYESEKLAGATATSRKKLVNGAKFKTWLDADRQSVQFDVKADKLLLSSTAIEPVNKNYAGELPDLYPIHCTVGIPKRVVTDTNALYPLGTSHSFVHPHTIFSYFDGHEIKNIHGTDVGASQFESRTLMQAFGVAAAKAKQYAANGLDAPIVVQSIQTDGRQFHFGVLQLNTLNLDAENDKKNYWFHQPTLELYSGVGYEKGRPFLTAYNPDVFRIFNAFYNN